MMLARDLDAGVPACWVTADEAYGQDSKFLLWLQQRHVGYVLAVPPSQKIPINGGSVRAEALAAAAPALPWKRRSCGSGAKGPRSAARSPIPTSWPTTCATVLPTPAIRS